MNRKKDPASLGVVDSAVELLESVMIKGGFALPTQSTQLDSDDLERYGQGQPKSFEQLKQSAAVVEQNIAALVKGNQSIIESLAIAARNGEKISDAVRERMRADRNQAEQELDKNG